MVITSMTFFSRIIRCSKLSPALVLTVLLLSTAEVAFAFASADSEFRVNSYTTDYQCYPSVATDQDGDFVVTWL